MKLEEILRDAGFKSKRQFASHIGVSANTVSSWGDDPPRLVWLYLGLLSGIKGIVDVR